MLYLSRVLRGDLRFYDLSSILERPEKNLVVFNDAYRSFYICILSDKNPGPIKIKHQNKSMVLLFDLVDEPLFKMSDIRTTHQYLISDTVWWDFCYSHRQYTGFVVKGRDYYYYYSGSDIEKTQIFYEALRNETNLITRERD